jgi:hypothetical protein
MRTITLLQPWASLVMCELKHYETMSWSTCYYWDLLIHAGKRISRDGLWLWEQLQEDGWLGVGRLPDCKFNDLPRGGIWGSVHLVGCFDTSRLRQTFSGGSIEAGLGDYSAGRFAWLLDVLKVFAQPIPAAGMLGLWEFEGELPA